MGKIYDVYHSESYHRERMNPIHWSYGKVETIPVININGAYITYSEVIQHGKKPLLERDDLVLIGTFNEDEMDIKVVNKSDYLEAFNESQMDYIGDIY